MSATSVSGTGPGAVNANNKGSERTSMSVAKLIGPHVISCGSVTLSSGTYTVTFPQVLANSKTAYVVMLTVVSASTTVARVTTKTDVSSQFSSFVITGGTTDVVDYAVISIG